MVRIHMLRKLVQLTDCRIKYIGIRNFLSQAYLCEEAWQKRLESPLLRNLDMDKYFIEVDRKFGKKLVSGVDIDLFVNNVQEESQLDELEHLLYRFRRTKQAVEMMDSTIYATIRTYLKFKNYESLFRILHDRDSYGIFPDFYSYNILMDTFLKEKLYKEAAQTAVLMMQQEDFSNNLSRLLGLYSCQKFLNECSLENLLPFPEENEEVKEENENEDEEDITYVRVPFLKNPWFDDHFDIVNPKHLLGKTFYLIGREMNDLLGRTYQMFGLVLYEKYEKASELLKTLSVKEEPCFLSEGVEKSIEELNSASANLEDSKKTLCDHLKKNVERLASEKRTVDGLLIPTLEAALKNIQSLEKEDIELQQKMFLDFEIQRQKAMDKQLKEIDKQNRLKAIEEKKEYLFWKEKLLFFFENEEKILDELKSVEEMVASMKSKKVVEDEYMPPEIVKKKPLKPTIYQKLARVKAL
ncbi:28S ribosomal protein S27, mitochondrial-like [Uloborus diversus]|uniref:28S ribosomal protein S27, mitochondrial-like n=1 Tax=Uloborus diversus TaxID=327109 RepID=UPI002409FFE5|nr:28S ribosomal protein S27, mitochondrial-like [Uloborus diversus]